GHLEAGKGSVAQSNERDQALRAQWQPYRVHVPTQAEPIEQRKVHGRREGGHGSALTGEPMPATACQDCPPTPANERWPNRTGNGRTHQSAKLLPDKLRISDDSELLLSLLIHGRMQLSRSGEDRAMSNGNNPTTVRFPGNAQFAAGEDVSAPLVQLLRDLHILATETDMEKAGSATSAFTGPPQSVAIIEAGATALGKWWTAAL